MTFAGALGTFAGVNRSSLFSAIVVGFVPALAGGCYDAGPYGYDRVYVPLSAEDDLLRRAQQPNYFEVRSDPATHEGHVIAWFGVVEGLDPQTPGDGVTVVKLSQRIHQDRHLCSDLERESCRVTVSERSEGSFSARIHVRPEDRGGRNRLQLGSLVRIYGTVTGDYDPDGGPILEARVYRHWPRGQYVTTGARREMRR